MLPIQIRTLPAQPTPRPYEALTNEQLVEAIGASLLARGWLDQARNQHGLDAATSGALRGASLTADRVADSLDAEARHRLLNPRRNSPAA